MDYFDLTQPSGSLTAAFAESTHLKFLVVSFTSDWLYPSYHSKRLVSALTAAGADVTYLDVKSSWGHDAFLLEVETMTSLIESFLGRLVREEQIAVPLVSPARALLRINAGQAPRTKLADSLA
jgi:homoserine O-acetyltransferase